MERFHILANTETLETVCAPFETQPENSLPYYEHGFLKPCFDQYPNPTVLVEGASQEEIDQANKANVPAVVTKRQLKQALVLAGIPLANIDAAIEQIPDATEKALMQIYWNDSTEFERYHPKLIEFSQALNITETQADSLFILANSL